MITFRLFNGSDEDYGAFIELLHQQNPEDKITLEEQRHWDSTQNPKYKYERFFILKDGEIRGMCTWREPHWSYAPGKYYLGIILPEAVWDDEIAQAAADHLMTCLEPLQPNYLIGSTREDYPHQMTWHEGLGMKGAMRYPRSQLDVHDFNFALYQGLEEKVREDGVQIRSAKELEEEGVDWKHMWYELTWNILPDVPYTAQLTQQPFEDFIKAVGGPNFMPESLFFARAADGEYLGLTSLWRSPVDTTILYTGLTGIKRIARRMGVATALKVHSIRFARDYGALRIETDNEEHNPMFQINLHLGYKPLPANLDYEKKSVND